MARIRKLKLSWTPSESNKVVGYRLYWSNGSKVDYGSNFIELGNVTEVDLPDILKCDSLTGESFMLGITAVDKIGNESDMLKLPAPYRVEAPPPPTAPLLKKLNRYVHVNTQKQTPKEPIKKPQYRVKYYDDVGFRRLAIDRTPSDSDCVAVKENEWNCQ